MSKITIIGGDYIENIGGSKKTYVQGDYEINSNKQIIQKAEQRISFGKPESPPEINNNIDFDITFLLNEDHKTVVPFGILDFKNEYENSFFNFKYSLLKSKIDQLIFKITDESGKILYDLGYLKPVIISAKKKSLFDLNAKNNIKTISPTDIIKTLDIDGLMKPYVLQEPDYTDIGDYVLCWNGFDNHGVYDSTRFNNKTLKAKITAVKEGKQKSIEIEFKTSYNEVQWVDVKINKKEKRIDTILRINLKDGGTEGLKDSSKISTEALDYFKKLPITNPSKNYDELKDLTLTGVSQFWSRNKSNIGKSVKIVNENFEVFVKANADENGLSAPKIVYQTNCEAGRSRNWELSRKLFYYEGYIYFDSWEEYSNNSQLYKNKGWDYLNAELEDYKMTSAHEIGHEIILTYGGHKYSKSHKGSSTVLTQKDLGTPLPETGEIDLMKYYKSYYDIARTIISETDLLQLIWLTKIKIK